jgi:hypothetical protein
MSGLEVKTSGGMALGITNYENQSLDSKKDWLQRHQSVDCPFWFFNSFLHQKKAKQIFLI